MVNLTLYYMDTCPFCRKVFRFLEEQDISVPMKDITSDPNARRELMDIGGKSQVPCLVIDGKALYESDEIIKWFKQFWGKV